MAVRRHQSRMARRPRQPLVITVESLGLLRTGDTVMVNGLSSPIAETHERTRGEKGTVRTIDTTAARMGLPPISVEFKTPGQHGSHTELFYPGEVDLLS